MPTRLQEIVAKSLRLFEDSTVLVGDSAVLREQSRVLREQCALLRKCPKALTDKKQDYDHRIR